MEEIGGGHANYNNSGDGQFCLDYVPVGYHLHSIRIFYGSFRRGTPWNQGRAVVCEQVCKCEALASAGHNFGPKTWLLWNCSTKLKCLCLAFSAEHFLQDVALCDL